MENPQGSVTGEVNVGEAVNATVVGVQYQLGPNASELAAAMRQAFAGRVFDEAANPHDPVFLVPPLPSFHVSRTSLIDSATHRLLAAGESGVLRIEALHGTGGTGKTTLAKAVCYLPESTFGLRRRSLGRTGYCSQSDRCNYAMGARSRRARFSTQFIARSV